MPRYYIDTTTGVYGEIKDLRFVSNISDDLINNNDSELIRYALDHGTTLDQEIHL